MMQQAARYRRRPRKPVRSRNLNIKEALYIASEHYKKGSYEQAERICRDIMAIDPGNAEAFFILGTIFQSMNKFDDAIRYFQETTRIRPEHFGAHFQLGITLFNRRKLDEAVPYLQISLRLNPDCDEAYCCLGMIFREKGQLDKAIDYFNEALRVNPASAWAYTNLAVALQQKGRSEEARRYLHKALKNNTYIQNGRCLHGIFLTDNQEPLRDITSSETRGRKKFLIVVSAFNRKKITALSLDQTRRYKTDYCRLQVYNDHSSDYDNTFLAGYADEVIRLPDKMGIDNLRWYQFRKFLETDYDFLYMTDNDVIHDPEYPAMLEKLYAMGKGELPVSLLNNISMLQPRLILYYEDGVFLKTSAPGASMFFDRRMVEKIISVSNKIGNKLDYLAWDNKAVACLGLPWITPEMSYLEHFGAGGISSDNYERERAINPTEYLQIRREPILQYLTEGDDLLINW
jgi:tetratricopeptide (TPR) repeat protein